MVSPSKTPTRPRLLLAWAVAIVAIAMLGLVRETTEAEFTFASAAILPVLLVAWIGGQAQGYAAAVMAALMWVAADLLSGRTFTAGWIPVANGLTRLATYCFVANLVGQVRILLGREADIARQDSLTGLMNRLGFFEAGETEANRAQRYAHPVAIVFLDLDDFKQLNDSRGHAVGDTALREVAHTLRSCLRASDRVARLGGDEFAVLLPEIDFEHAGEAVRKLATRVEHTLIAFPPASASIGAAWFPDGMANFPEMLKAADSLMYEVKRNGKGSVCLRAFPKDISTPLVTGAIQ